MPLKGLISPLLQVENGGFFRVLGRFWVWFQVMVVSHGFQIGFETAYPNDDGRIDSTGPAHADCYTRLACS